MIFAVPPDPKSLSLDLFNSDNRPILIREFVGKFNMTERDAIELVRKSIRKFNYPTNLVHMDVQPSIHRPVLPRIPRLSIFWWTQTEDDLQSKVEAEVDLDKGELKSLYYDDKAYWNHPPPIDVPITLPVERSTNQVPAARSGKSAFRNPPPRPQSSFNTPLPR